MGQRQLTAVLLLVNIILDSALVGFRVRLRFETSTRRSKASAVHSLLQGIIFPSKHVVTVLAVSSTMKKNTLEHILEVD